MGPSPSRWVPPPRVGAVLFLAAAVLAVFGAFLRPGTHLILSESHQDLDTQILWWRQFAFSQLGRGHLALWNPYLFGGSPFFGYLQPGLLYPPNWLYLVMPLAFAVNFQIALHVFLGGWFTFLWVEKREARALPGLLAGFMFMFGAALFLRIVPGHLLNISAMPWTPLWLFAIEGFRKDRRVGWILLGILAVGFQVLSGQMQLFYYGVLFTGAYTLFTSPREKRGGFLGGVLAMGAGGLLLGAVQILAGWDAAQESLRGSGMTLAAASSTPMAVEKFWCLLLPGLFGYWNDYWGARFYWEGAVYVGLTGFVLACVGLQSLRPQKKFFAWAFLVLACTAVGRRSPLYLLFYHALPLFSHFRGVAKLDFLMTLCLAALAAMGLVEVLEDPKRLPGLARWTAWGAGVMVLAAGAVQGLAWHGGGRWAKYMPYAGGMVESFLVAAGQLVFLSFLARLGGKRPALRYGFLVLACAELSAFAWANRPCFDEQALLRKVEPVRQAYQKDPGDYRVLADSKNYVLGTGGWDVWGYDTNIPMRYARFMALAQGCRTDDFLEDTDLRRLPPALGLVRLRYAFQEKKGALAVTRLHFKEPPPYFLVGRWQVVPEEEALRRDVGPGFDPLKEASLESDPGIPQAGRVKGRVRVQDLSTDALRVDARLSKPALLVLDANYSHGWKALADPGSAQKAYQVVPVDGFLRGVPLVAGEHHFILRYRPAAYVAGKWISLVSWGFFFLGLAVWRVRGFPGKRGV